MIAAPEIGMVAAKAHQFLTFTTPPMLQYALAEALADDALLQGLQADWAATRAVLNAGLAGARLTVLPGAATWFTCIDLAA
ncbi:hypothetical protein ABTM51_20395, partial [Acinetobacter baumannii]